MTQHTLYNNAFRLDVTRLGKYLDEISEDGKSQSFNIPDITYERIQLSREDHLIIYNLFGEYTLMTHHHLETFSGLTVTLRHNASHLAFKKDQWIKLSKITHSQGDSYALDALYRMDPKTMLVSEELARFFVDYGGMDDHFQPITSKDLPLFNSGSRSDKNED